MATEETTTATDNTNAEVTTDATTDTTNAQADTSASTTDTKADDSTGKDPAAETQPTEADYTFSLPDGFTANEELTGDLKAFALENKLSVESAQKIADLGVKMQQMQQAEYAKQIEGWETELKSDKDIGGDKFDENVGLVKQVVKTFGGDELLKLLSESGFASNPTIFKAFVKIGKSVSNDTLVVANGTSNSSTKEAANVLFPNMK